MSGKRKVRATARNYVNDQTDGRVWGNYVDPRVIDEFVEDLKRELAEGGYTPCHYADDVGPDGFGAVAFAKGQMPFREEPALIDYGSCQLDGRDVLKVAIRDAEGKNKPLHDKVLMLMARSRIMEPNSIGSVDECAEGTQVYALKRAYWLVPDSDFVH